MTDSSLPNGPSPSSPDDAPALPIAPPPWTCHYTAYTLPFLTSSSSPVPNSKILAPLEASSETWVSERITGKFKGGVGFAQILRYTDTPVGTYDELVITPGAYEAPEGLKGEGEKKGQKDKAGLGKGKYIRITGIWVSQEATCMNGRKNWNIPKHIARFTFTPTTSSPLPLRVEVSDPSSNTPFFSTTIHPTSYTPTFSFNSNWQGYLGFPTKCLQPPLPSGNPPDVEVGTDAWMRIAPVQNSKKARIVWFDMQQPRAEAAGGGNEGESSKRDKGDNWWPGMGRWRLGVSLEEATLELGDPDIFRAQ